MIPKEQFLALIEDIVAAKAPSEEMAFVVAGPEVAETLYTHGEINTTRSSAPGEFQFMAETTQVLQFVAVMAGTFNAVQKVVEAFRGAKTAPVAVAPPKEELAPAWTKELEKSGVPGQMAREISDLFSSKLQEMLERRDNKEQAATS